MSLHRRTFFFYPPIFRLNFGLDENRRKIAFGSFDRREVKIQMENGREKPLLLFQYYGKKEIGTGENDMKSQQESIDIVNYSRRFYENKVSKREGDPWGERTTFELRKR